jgi:hypothetical protein
MQMSNWTDRRGGEKNLSSNADGPALEAASAATARRG